MWRNLESREAEDYWGIGSGSAHPPRRWSEEKLEEELGSAVSSPNLGWPLASIIACALLLSPTFLFPSSLLPSHLLFIYSPLLGRKYLYHLYPTFWNLQLQALESIKKLGSRQRNKQVWGHRCHCFAWCHLAKTCNWHKSFLAHHSFYLICLVLNSHSTLPS